ncbi:MAG: hypothetical protein M3P45_09610 [Acidobacteriota bacterium]|nr:hypothetical protein [Acidobacteriota bacterium]
MSVTPLGWEHGGRSAPAQPSPVKHSSSDSQSSFTADASSMHSEAHSSAPISVQDPAPPPTARGFLNIIRHGAGPSALYVVTYRRLDLVGVIPKPILAEGARLLIELLERLGVNLDVREVREALEDILRLGSANIPGLWLTDEQMAEQGLIEA